MVDDAALDLLFRKARSHNGWLDKPITAPVIAIVAYDAMFYEHLPQLFPRNPQVAELFASNAALSATTAFRNGTLQGGYFLLAARAVGLDCGPMSGFDN